MNIKPMIFNTEMVRALIDDRKTQTRRPISFPVRYREDSGYSFMDKQSKWWACGIGLNYSETVKNFASSKSPWQVGDLIYVRETFREFDASNECDHLDPPCSCPRSGAPVYFADNLDSEEKWKPSIHMPRSASRLTLKVTDIRVERVQDISKIDAVSEGFKLPPADGQGCAIGARTNFRHAWQRIYPDSWERNDWVWVIDFEVIRENIDEYVQRTEKAA